MSDLTALTPARFEACQHQRFVVELDGRDAVPLELVDVQRRGAAPQGRREPFSLVFRGPQQPVLPQRIYALRNETLGRLEIFLVPIGPHGDGMGYEAVFG